MLFDDKDLLIFENNESKVYFKEILQLYYNQNYRSSVVMLYSFIIYDLYMKLQTMANEGDDKATKKLREINSLISDDAKYSTVENNVIQFFIDNCELYFKRFIEDIEYLKICRNKCAHLKVNDSSLYIPKDYVARMLICSMYDNILSVKAPFIMDLFNVVQSDIELYSASAPGINNERYISSVSEKIRNKYLIRMTYDSLKKSYKTFIKLLWVSENEDTEKNIIGIFLFAFSVTDYAVKQGYSQLFSEDQIINTYKKIDNDTIKNSTSRKKALIIMLTTFPILVNVIRENESVFEYICNDYVKSPNGLKYYRLFYPNDSRSIYFFFKDTPTLHKPLHIVKLYGIIKESDDFSIDYFTELMFAKVPSYYGFDEADEVTDFFIRHIEELSDNSIKKVMEIYNKNDQFKNRYRHSNDIEKIKKYLEKKESENNSTTDDN